mgnify:CR=1 FL=1
MHNGHVLKMMRWRHFCAVNSGNQFAQFIWSSNYYLEMGEDEFNEWKNREK